MTSRTARRAALDIIAPVWSAHDVPTPRTWSGPGDAYAVAPAESPDRLSHRMPRRIEAFDLGDGSVQVQLRTWLAGDPWEAVCRTPDEVRAFVRSVLADIGGTP